MNLKTNRTPINANLNPAQAGLVERVLVVDKRLFKLNEEMIMSDGHCWDDNDLSTCLRCGDKDWMADDVCSKKNKAVKSYEQYCPLCERLLTAINIKEVGDGSNFGYLFVHDDVFHDDDAIEAIDNGVN